MANLFQLNKTFGMYSYKTYNQYSYTYITRNVIKEQSKTLLAESRWTSCMSKELSDGEVFSS